MDYPLISVIIATYNAAYSVEKTILSILNQSYKNFEIIIIDGASSDNTLLYIEKYKSHLSYCISENDTGIYDAWNKGLIQAKGQWISFLGAGDEYLPEAFHCYIDFLSTLPNDIEFISSRVVIVDTEGALVNIQGKSWCWPLFLSNMMCAHVGALHSRKLFEKYGCFDTTYKIAGDYEFLMRAKSMLKAAFLPLVTVHMLNGGISTSSTILIEDRRLKIHTGNKPRWKANLEFLINSLKRLVRILYSYFGLLMSTTSNK